MEKYSRFFGELYSSVFIVHPDALNKYLPYLKAINQGKIIALPEKKALKMGMFDQFANPFANPEDQNEPETEGVAVIPINGVITRAGGWWDYGTEEISDCIEDAYEDDSISAIVLQMDCMGGSADSIFPIKEALAQKTKPVICAVDSQAYSLGYYIAALCDKVIAVDNMAQVGSIGVMASLVNWDGAYKKMGIKKIDCYPPESNWKNRAYNEAIEGKPALLIKEELSPWAQHFQAVVRACRPKLNEGIEGTLQGRTFFANFTPENAMINGLIDDIMPMGSIIQYAFQLAKSNQTKQFFKS